ncbi:MAG: flagellar biosynthesis protein FlgE [Pseudomonadota bacterium]
MAVNPILSSGAQGIERGLRGLEETAAKIAGATSPEREQDQPREPNSRQQVEAQVDLKLYKRQVQASAKVVETADATIGFLLDKRV